MLSRQELSHWGPVHYSEATRLTHMIADLERELASVRAQARLNESQYMEERQQLLTENQFLREKNHELLLKLDEATAQTKQSQLETRLQESSERELRQQVASLTQTVQDQRRQIADLDRHAEDLQRTSQNLHSTIEELQRPTRTLRSEEFHSHSSGWEVRETASPGVRGRTPRRSELQTWISALMRRHQHNERMLQADLVEE